MLRKQDFTSRQNKSQILVMKIITFLLVLTTGLEECQRKQHDGYRNGELRYRAVK